MNESAAEIKGFIKGLFWGILASIGLLIFLETERGQKLKKEFKGETEGFLDSLPDLIDKLEEKGEKLIKEAGEIERELAEKKEEVGQEIAKATHIETLQEHGREIAQGIKARFFKNLPKKPKPSAMN